MKIFMVVDANGKFHSLSGTSASASGSVEKGYVLRIYNGEEIVAQFFNPLGWYDHASAS